MQGWATAVQDLYGRATSTELAPDQRRARQRACEQEALTLCQPWLAGPAAPQARLCRRIVKHLPDLFVFVADPAVPPTNNAAERALRPLVTCRKISGGSRSPAGTEITLTLASLFATWRVRDLTPFEECCRLLAGPHFSPAQV